MPSFRAVVWSSVGKKLISGVTGLGLCLFVLAHLIGNLTLLIPDRGHAFNSYAHFLETLAHGWFIIAFEIGLGAFLVFHVITGIWVALVDKGQARPVGYQKRRDAGGASRKTLSSRSMIITGIVLGVFVPVHVWMFKFGDAALITAHGGGEMRDLYGLVVEAFQNPLIAFGYVAVMILLGYHLRHGAWSAFQSLGWNNERWLPALYGAAALFAVALAAGFLFLPIYIYFAVDPTAPAVAAAGGAR
jgi:succinate dehydrogenase / fumarate reductase cytochrome b subunit